MAVIEGQIEQRAEAPSADRSETIAYRSDVFLLLAFAALFSLILPREFPGPESPAPGRIHEQIFAGFRWIDLIIVAITGMIVMARAGTGRLFKLGVPSSISRWAALFGVAVVVALLYGSLTGGTELFFDWRGIALGIALMLVIYQLLHAKSRLIHRACLTLILVFGMRAAFQLFNFVSGITTTTLLGQRIPIFDGPSLSNTVFVMIASGCLALGWREGGFNIRLVLGAMSLIAFMLIALAFRRSYWGEAAVALILMLLVFNRRRFSIFLTAVVAFAILIPFLPNEFILRLDSANPFASHGRNPYTVTNEDHLGDIADAWAQIKKNPILGFGLGKPYETSRIRDWKDVSWGVHNGPLHVWLRYGALGLVSYLGVHLALLKWLLRSVRRWDSQSFERWWLLAIFSYISATFVVACFATPWAYGSTQNSLFIFSLIGTALAIQNKKAPSRPE